MKKLLFFLLIPIICFSQWDVGGGISSTTVLSYIADSTEWVHLGIHGIAPKAGKSVHIDSLFTNILITQIDTAYNRMAVFGQGGSSIPFKVFGNKTSGDLTQWINDKIGVAGDSTATITKLGGLQVSTGTDAAPALAGLNDTDTGIRFPGGNKMQFIQNGINSHTIRPYRKTITYSDGDTLSLWLNGTDALIKTNATSLSLDGASTVGFSVGGATQWIAAAIFYPAADDAKQIGYMESYGNKRVQKIYLSDYGYIGGKGQTATIIISGENTFAGIDSSWKMSAASGIATLEGMHTGTFTNGGRRTYFGADTLALFNGSKTGRDSATYVLPSGLLVAATIKIGSSNFTTTQLDTIFTAGYKPRWVKFTSGGKEWFSQVYAATDTTGKW